MSVKRIVPVLVAAVTGLSVLVVPSSASGVQATQSQVVSAVPAAYTPNVNNGRVYTIAQSGSTVVMGGTFSSVTAHSGSPTIAVHAIAAFTAGTGALVTSFKPTLNGQVDSIAAGPIPGTVYVGGSFSNIDGVGSRVALISATTGAIVPGWKSPSVSGEVNTVVASGGRLYIGGYFTNVGGQPHVGLAVLDGSSGAVLSIGTPAFVGHHNYGVHCDPATATCATSGTGIKSMDINPAGNRLVAIGNFTSAGGLPRDQIAMLDLTGSSATIDTSWATAAYTAGCASSAYDTYVRDIQFSPDGSYFVVAVTGGGAGQRNSDGTQTSCDTAARWATGATGSDVRPTWIDYTGNDTFLSVAITGTAVYVGGHQRWVNNTKGSDQPGEGAVPRPGIVAFDPLNGLPLTWNPGRSPRGAGAYALLATSDGLYVGSDTDYIGPGKYLHRKIAFFPLAGGYRLAANSAGSVPGDVYLLGSGSSSSTAREVSWDGTVGGVSPTTSSSVNWSGARGAFMINNDVYYGATDGHFYERTFNGSTYGPAVAVDPYDDPVWDNVQTGSGQTYRGTESNFYSEMSSLTSMFYSNGRVYYTLSGQSHMYWRWFEPDSGVMGADEFQTSDSLNWSSVKGAFLSGSTLYYADSGTKALFRVPFTNGQAGGTPTVANSSIDWTSAGAFVISDDGSQPPPANLPPVAAFTAGCTGLTCSVDGSASYDPDGSSVGYSWDWGDGSSTPNGDPVTSHTYDAAGTDTVTLTVTDANHATDTATQVVTPGTDPPPPSSPVTFRGASSYDANGTSGTVTVPSATAPGDRLLLFVSYATTSATPSVPAGWTQVGSTTSYSQLRTAVYQRAAQAGDAGRSVTVTFSALLKAALTIADYSGVSGAVSSAAVALDANTTAHKSPTLSGLAPGSLVVTFWTDKSTGTKTWTSPASVARHSSVFGSGGGAVSAMLTDSGSAVRGSYGGLTATTNASSGSGATWAIALANS
jgi:PKD repeat protein